MPAPRTTPLPGAPRSLPQTPITNRQQANEFTRQSEAAAAAQLASQNRQTAQRLANRPVNNNYVIQATPQVPISTLYTQPQPTTIIPPSPVADYGRYVPTAPSIPRSTVPSPSRQQTQATAAAPVAAPAPQQNARRNLPNLPHRDPMLAALGFSQNNYSPSRAIAELNAMGYRTVGQATQQVGGGGYDATTLRNFGIGESYVTPTQPGWVDQSVYTDPVVRAQRRAAQENFWMRNRGWGNGSDARITLQRMTEADYRNNGLPIPVVGGMNANPAPRPANIPEYY